MMLLKEIKSKEEYTITDMLFVVSTSDENTVRNDKAYEMNNFRDGEIRNRWGIPNSQWKIFLFAKGEKGNR